MELLLGPLQDMGPHLRDLGFRVSGFRIYGLEFKDSGFWVDMGSSDLGLSGLIKPSWFGWDGNM